MCLGDECVCEECKSAWEESVCVGGESMCEQTAWEECVYVGEGAG